MAKISRGYLHAAGSDDSNGGLTQPQLSTVLRDINTDITGIDPGTPAWSAALTLTSNQVVMTQAGLVVSVYASAGGTPAPKLLIPTGTPATGQARVTYDAKGIPTILLAAGDSHTAIQVQQIKRVTSFARRSINT